MTKRSVVNVLVTGMGPYPSRNGHIDDNTSYLVTTVLPRTLEPNTAQNPSPIHLNILTLPEPIKTEYGYARQFLKDMHEKHARDVDLFIHLGEARGWPFVTIERAAYKQGMSSVWWAPKDEIKYYTTLDDAGLRADDVGPCPWDQVPMGLQSALDVDTVADGARNILTTRYQFAGAPAGTNLALPTTTTSPDPQSPRGPAQDARGPIEIKPHNEGGPYLCGFVNYESLANCYVNKRRANVLFCHVPGEADPQSLGRTREGLLAIIVSAANAVAQQKL
ncbi:hypothetical protein BX600DRAFT_513303 [Xylariales sp. PMI_506]|nr:hypothetical protein BX600DRAFT_513303 [Xylariales sp. PMI_506]